MTTPVPELLAEKVPLKVAEKLFEPAVGIVWVIVRVNVPETAIAPVPETNVWKLPKLEPVGVFKLVEPNPVKVIITALPIPPRKVTALVPLPEHPAHVNTPDVEKVTGSALAADAANIITPATAANIKNFFRCIAIIVPCREELTCVNS